MKILLVEDNESIVKGLEYSFTKETWEVVSKETVRGTRESLSEHKPDLIILDISLPDGNGLSLYENTIKDLEIPTIFLTAQDDEEMVVKGLDIGAEDYITKPFSTKELIARVKKIYARNKKETLVKVDDIEYEISCLFEYVEYLKTEIERLEQVDKYYEKMIAQKRESKQEYFAEGMRVLFRKNETVENYKDVLNEYRNALSERQLKIDKLNDEIKKRNYLSSYLSSHSNW